MKRPLALIGLTSMFVLAVCFYGGYTFALIAFAVALAGLSISLAVRKIRRLISPIVFFATVMLSVTVFTLFAQFYIYPLQEKYDLEEASVTATLCEEGTYHNGRYFYELKAESINSEKADVKLSLASLDALMCKVGDKLSFTADIEPAGYSRYYADRMYLSSYVYYEDSVNITSAGHKPLYYFAVELRDKLRSAFYLELEYDNAALSSAVLLGDKSGFRDEVYQDLKRAGLTHVVVVSGLHLSIITMLYKKLFGKIIKNKYVNILCSMLVVFFFLFLTGFGKSSIRAAIMLCVLLLSDIFNREGDSVNSLGLAAILLCMVNPCVVGDVGVLLSFSATFGIVAFSKPLENFLTKGLKPLNQSRCKFLNKALRYFAALFSTTFTAAVATLPVTVLFFGRVSLVQIISNLFILPFVQYFMMFAALCAVFHFVPFLWWITELFAFCADLIGRLMLSLSSLFASLPMAYVKADYSFVLFWIFASLVLLSLAYLIRRKGKGLNILCGILSVLILISGSLGHILACRDTITLYITPSEHGNGVVIDSKDGNIVLVCSGENYTADSIMQTLETLYTENQLMIIASYDNGASESAEDIITKFDYEEILMYDTDDRSEHAENIRAKGVTNMYGKCNISLWDKATLSITEEKGAVYQYLSAGSTSVLILPPFGDVSDIPKEMRNPDVLITSGMLEDMELLSFTSLISNGTDFESVAVIEFFKDRQGTKVSVDKTITLDIAG